MIDLIPVIDDHCISSTIMPAIITTMMIPVIVPVNANS